MKKILVVLAALLVAGFVLCSGIAFFRAVPAEIPQSMVFQYKILSGLSIFLDILPVLVLSGFAAGCSVFFGRNSEGSLSRFSAAMFRRYKTVMILSIICVFLLTVVAEIASPAVNGKRGSIRNRRGLIDEYLRVGNSLYENGFYARAGNYARAVLALDPDSSEAENLEFLAEEKQNSSVSSGGAASVIEKKSAGHDTSVDRADVDGGRILEAYGCFVKAQEAFDSGSWFNAHYFAENGIMLSSSKDPNLGRLKEISAEAWNNLTERQNTEKSDSQKIFARKYEGYKALIGHDDLKAYYIFKELSRISDEMSRDPDVVFYLDIASARINDRYFFTDETLGLDSLESASDVYFACTYPDGSRDIFYIKGVTSVAATGNSIQYLRGLAVESVDSNGNFVREMKVPYAKVLPVSVDYIDAGTRKSYGIEDGTDEVPFVMLKSIGRDSDTGHLPEYNYADGSVGGGDEYMLLPLPFEDLVMIEKSSVNFDGMPLPSLFGFIRSAEKYGYQQQLCVQIFMNRILYPLFMLWILVFAAAFAWNSRIGLEQVFRFSWIFLFPFFFGLVFVFFSAMQFVFRMMNYIISCDVVYPFSLAAGLAVNVALLAVSSVMFLSRKV